MIIVAFATATPALAEKRVALVIGNAAYQNVPKLPNPVADAGAVAASLKDLGFEVIVRTDLDQPAMAAAMSEFVTDLAGADVALLYYAGHAIQFEGQNYLVATNATMSNAFALNSDAIQLGQVIEAMQTAAKINLVLLDACRNNPFVDRLKEKLPATRAITVTQGLARFSVQKGDTMVVYATAANQTAADGAGKHSPFTQALLDHIGTPGLEVSLLLKKVVQDVREKTLYQQSPEVLSAMASEFYFARTPPTPAPDAGLADFDAVNAAYRVATAEDTAEAWRGFLKAYPDAALASFARDSLVRAEAREARYDPAVSFEEAEARLKLTSEERRSIQITLAALGYQMGTPDGQFGPQTRTAVQGFQFDKGLMPTGYVDTATRARLESEDVRSAAARSFQAADGLTGKTAEGALALTHEEIRLIKLGLSAKGLATDPGQVGFGGTDRGSIKQIQFKAGAETPDGYLTADLAAELLGLGRRQGANLARFINPGDLADGTDPRLVTLATRFRGSQIKYAYYGSSLYAGILQDADFDEAQKALEGTGGHLVVFSSAAEKKFIDAFIRTDSRFFVCDETWCQGPVVGYYQLATAKRSGDGWVSVTGEPTGRLPWFKGQPNELMLARSVGFASYGNEGSSPVFELADMIRFQQRAPAMLVEFPPVTGGEVMQAKN